MRYVCSVCGYIYDEAREKQAFSELPDSWRCPVCKAAKAVFVPEKKADGPKAASAPATKALSGSKIPAAAGTAGAVQAEKVRPSSAPAGEEGLERLSVGQLAALCSNLARGCEKQYKAEEAALLWNIQKP